jgi:ABC-2 type transport system permease protein
MARTDTTGADGAAGTDSGTGAGGVELAAGGDHEVPSGPIWLLRDSWTEALRHLRALPRSPELLIFATIQPVMFVLLFVYVFGGSIEVPGYDDYNQFLLPGIFAQTVLFGSAFTGIGIAEDLSKGLIDRLRSLPMYQSAVLIGRTISDVVRNVITFAVMLVVAFAVGFRVEGSILEAVAATLLLLGFSYAFSWVQAYMGLSVGSVEAANSAGFIWMFPLTFVSSAFVDPENMPDWLEPIADGNPFTVVTNATRALYNGRDPGNDVWISLAWAVGITVVFALLSARKFASAAKR